MDFTTLQTALTLCIDATVIGVMGIFFFGILEIATRNCFTRSSDYKAFKAIAKNNQQIAHSSPQKLPAAQSPAIAIEPTTVAEIAPAPIAAPVVPIAIEAIAPDHSDPIPLEVAEIAPVPKVKKTTAKKKAPAKKTTRKIKNYLAA